MALSSMGSSAVVSLFAPACSRARDRAMFCRLYHTVQLLLLLLLHLWTFFFLENVSRLFVAGAVQVVNLLHSINKKNCCYGIGLRRAACCTGCTAAVEADRESIRVPVLVRLLV